MSHEINGWHCAPRTDVILGSGENHNVVANEHMVLYPPEAGCSVTGFEPPTPPTSTMAWLMSVSNGGADDIVFPHNDTGSTEGQRVLMPPGFSQYTLSFGQTAWFAMSYNSDLSLQGWYPLVPGVMS